MKTLFRILIFPSQLFNWVTFSFLQWLDEDVLDEVMCEFEDGLDN